MVVLINFQLFPHTPSIACSFIQCITGKNKARLTLKIVGSYSRVFTVPCKMFSTLFWKKICKKHACYRKIKSKICMRSLF